MSKREKETYLGDAVYASFDGEWIKLRTEGQEIVDRTSVIYLDASAFAELAAFAKKCWERKT